MCGIKLLRNLTSVLVMLTIADRAVGLGTEKDAKTKTVVAKQPALRKELLKREQQDQETRRKLVDWAKKNNLTFGSKEFDRRGRAYIEEVVHVDAGNRKWFGKVVEKYGWPGKSLVGADGAQAAYLLVQHANRDLALQKRCLKLMKETPKGEVKPEQVAYLTDRVRLADGKKQVYGTQVESKEGRWQVLPVEAPEGLDARRKEIGLPPIAVYLRMVQEVYGGGENRD